MTEFVSEIKTIEYPDNNVYAVLSDLSNLEKIKDRIPQDKIQDFTCDTDSCTLSVSPIGKVKFIVVERQPNSLVKLEAQQTPFPVNLWIQLKNTDEHHTKMKITVRTDLNPFLKPMVSKPLQQAVDKISEMIAAIPYDKV
ncbi:MAG: SRPBCC family protein [Dysgonomonas sp.]